MKGNWFNLFRLNQSGSGALFYELPGDSHFSGGSGIPRM